MKKTVIIVNLFCLDIFSCGLTQNSNLFGMNNQSDFDSFTHIVKNFYLQTQNSDELKRTYIKTNAGAINSAIDGYTSAIKGGRQDVQFNQLFNSDSALLRAINLEELYGFYKFIIGNAGKLFKKRYDGAYALPSKMQLLQETMFIKILYDIFKEKEPTPFMNAHNVFDFSAELFIDFCNVLAFQCLQCFFQVFH